MRTQSVALQKRVWQGGAGGAVRSYGGEAEAKAALKAGVPARLYVLCGSEAYLKQHYALGLAQAAVHADFRDFNFHRFEGKALDLNTLAQAVEALPLGQGRTCVLVRDFALEGLGSDAAFLAFLAALPAHCCLLLWMDTASFSPKKSKALAEAMLAVGQVLLLEPPEAAAMCRKVLAGAKARGCTMNHAVAEYLVQNVGGDLHLLQNELQKLCDYAGGGALTCQMVDAVCVKSVEARAFDMVKELLQGHGTAAMQLLDALFRQRVAPPLLLGALVTQYVDIFRAMVCRLAGRPADDAATLFDYKGKGFRLRNAAGFASKLTQGQVAAALAALDLADRRLKSTGMEPRLVLEVCVLTLLELAHAKG